MCVCAADALGLGRRMPTHNPGSSGAPAASGGALSASQRKRPGGARWSARSTRKNLSAVPGVARRSVFASLTAARCACAADALALGSESRFTRCPWRRPGTARAELIVQGPGTGAFPPSQSQAGSHGAEMPQPGRPGARGADAQQTPPGARGQVLFYSPASRRPGRMGGNASAGAPRGARIW
ncbi:hypothetical protein HYPSUDRAFT_211296 [Hypholoma sublateritium FD-334 SS-4]|uniref:Uncharacterized protein n=1 Tax=Hypholoma sublateritium (strain FD-334 SS-4) TaxID=945553 RepID=A0A0D2LMW6_HYPSF|nr:hypothetical protein HYPSUDRAFT_211296 [Hypholoma sublateritium FD-334 SS-4]